MKEKQTQMWIPLYVDKWIFGSTRIELEPAERGVFIDLMAFGAKDEGYIRANEITAYPHTQLAGLLNIPVELLNSTIVKCIHFAKLEEPSPGIYKLCNWDKFQLSDDYKYRINTGRKAIPGAVRQNSDCSPTNPGPIREDKRRENKREEDTTKRGFAPPTIEQVMAYCIERGNIVNPDKWFNHYESNGWLVGKNKMKDWKAAIRTWEHSEYGNTTPKLQQGPIPARINPFDEVDKEMKLTKELEDFHSKHTSGGTCSFCGAKSNGVRFWTCNCAEYQSAIKEIRGKYYAKR